jgi:hypothetical protein
MWAFGAMLALGDVAHAADTDSDLRSRIHDAWSKRQARLSAVSVEWSEKFLYRKGAQTLPPSLAQRFEFPAEDVLFDAPSRLTLNGDWMRYETKNRGIYEGKTVVHDYISSYDGRSSRNHFFRGDKYPVGGIRKESERHNADQSNFRIRALMLWCRPLAKQAHSINLGELRFDSDRQFVKDRPCVYGSSVSGLEEVWLDPERDFVVCRVRERQSGKTKLDVTIEYAFDERHGWAPSAWKAFADFSLEVNQTDATVTKVEVGNARPQEYFHLEFPVGTWVVDTRSNAEHLDYIILEGGRIRPVPQADATATYEQIIASEPGMALQTPRRSRFFFWVVSFNALGATAIVAVCLWRRRKGGVAARA